MLEPLLMLTFLNCFFMFSTTVTTCALWLQNKRNHCCAAKSPPRKKERLKNILKEEIIHNKSLQKISSKLADKRRDLSRPKDNKSKKNELQPEKKSFGIMAQPEIKSTHQQLATNCCEKLTSTDDFTMKKRNSPANRKSTVVMEVSTIQKVVQLIDNEKKSSKHSVSSDYVSYKMPPDSERHIEFIVQNKPDGN